MKTNVKISYRSPHTLCGLPQDTPVLLAFSGGADSSALFSLLLADSKAKGFKLSVAHFNHGIRGEEAERDAQFCKSEAQKHGVPFYLGKADVPTIAEENGNSLEAEARDQRYAFFEQIMREQNIPVLATAHHAEDQIESIMLHILRGSGITGLRGMAECRTLADGLYLVRPLLGAEKQDILDFCKQNGVQFVTDSTNADTNYTRNSLRADVTPRLRAIQPNLSGVFARLAQSAAEADDLIERSALEFIDSECRPHVPLEKFNALHTAVKARVLTIAFAKYSSSSLERVHINSITALCEKQEPHSSVSVPNKLSARIENGSLIFEDDDRGGDGGDFSIPFCEGESLASERVAIRVEKNPADPKKDTSLSLDIKCSLLGKNVYFRSKKDGDTVFTGKMNKKVKKLINEKKIPLNDRKKLPILVSDNEILWIPSVAVCDKIKMDKIKNGDDFFRITVKFVN